MSLIANALVWLDYTLPLAIYAGACAGLLATVVLVINILFRRWLSASQMGLLWGIVLLRLLIPVAPPSSLSLQNLLWSAQIAMAEPSDVICLPVADSGDVAYSRASAATPAAPHAIDLEFSIGLLFRMLPLVWLTGGAVCLIWTTIVHWRLCRRLKQVTACEDQRLRSIWEACCSQTRVRGSIPILLFDGVQQPAVLGLFRPRLLLPTDATELNDQQLRMIMLHELAHVRRWDIAANWVLVIIRSIHWWNPVYWLAAARFRSLREQSCDAFAIRQIEGQPTRSYGELLLTLSQRQPSGPPWRVMLPVSILGFFSSFFRKRAVHNRLKALQSATVTRSRWHTAGVAGLVALVAVCGLTDAHTPEMPPDHSSDWLPRGHDWNTWDEPPIDPGPIVTRTYDVEKVLTRLAANERSRDDARVKLKSLLILILRGITGQFHAVTVEGMQEGLTFDGSTLTMTAPLNMHAEIARNLSTWEQSGLGQICVETRFLTDERDIASMIGVSWQYLEAFSDDREADIPSETKIGMPVVRAKASVDDYLPIAVATLNKQQAFALVQASQGYPRANILQAPKVTIFNGQQFSIQDCSKSPFVVGIQQDSAGVQQPKIAVIDEGIKLIMRAIQRSDTTKVQLEGRIELSHIDKVHTVSTLLRGEPATIQIPRVKRCRIDVSSEVQDGQSLLIGCIPTYEQKKFFYVLLTVQNIETN